MKRRRFLISVSSIGVLTSGCLDSISNTKSVPLEVTNESGSQSRLSITVTNNSTGEEVFSDDIKLKPGESSEITIKKLKKDVTYTMIVISESGMQGQAYIDRPTRSLDVIVEENGELTVVQVVS